MTECLPLCRRGLLAYVYNGVSLTMNALVAGTGSYIVRLSVRDLHGPTSPFLRRNWASIGLCLNLPNLPLIVQIPWKAYKKHGTSLYCETGAPLVAIRMTLTLEPIKSLCTISTMRLVFLAWWSRSVTFRGCAIQSSGGSWSTILFGRAICGTLGGCFPEKPLPFKCSVRLAFLLGLCWSFKPHL